MKIIFQRLQWSLVKELIWPFLEPVTVQKKIRANI